MFLLQQQRTRPRLAQLRVTLALVALLILTSCGNPAGTPCQISGGGFTASHDCQYKCLQYLKVSCPDGTTVTPGTCSGPLQCAPGSCPNGQTCYSDNDPFEDRSYCVAATTCGDLQPAQRKQWELDSLAKQQDAQKQRAEKQARKNTLKPKQRGTTEPL